MASFESSLERDYLALLEFDAEVSSYTPQPLRVSFLDGSGRRHGYVPDVLVHYSRARSRLVEVKYRRDLFANWHEYKPRLKAAQAYARARGWRFSIMTEVEIRTDYLQNVRFLLPYQRYPANRPDAKVLLRTLRELREATPEELTVAIYRDAYNRATLIPTLWNLVARRLIKTDLRVPLTMVSRIWV